MTILLEELNAKGKCTLPIGMSAMLSPAWQRWQELGGSWAILCSGELCLCCSCLRLELEGS